MGLVSTQSWVMPVLVPCLQGREIQQTLESIKDLNLPPALVCLGSCWDFTAFRAVDKVRLNGEEM